MSTCSPKAADDHVREPDEERVQQLLPEVLPRSTAKEMQEQDPRLKPDLSQQAGKQGGVENAGQTKLAPSTTESTRFKAAVTRNT